MIRAGSQTYRLLFRLMIATGVALVATVALIWWQFEHASTIVLNRGLDVRLAVIEENLALDDQERIIETLSALEKAAFDDHLFFTITDETGRAFLSVPSGRDRSYHPFEIDLLDAPQFFEHNYLHSGENYLGVTKHVVVGGKEFWLQLVEEVTHFETFFHYSTELLLSGTGVLIVLHFVGFAFVAYHTIRSSFEPVERAAREAEKVAPGNTDIRIPVDGLPTEVVPLARAANDALDRMERAIGSQKRFVADAAHELLTPVSIMSAEIEMLEDRALAGSLKEQMQELADMVQQLLELSELEAENLPPSEAFDLRRVAEEVLTKLAPMAIRNGIAPALTGTDKPVLVKGCPKALGSALRNLITNAIQHASGATHLEVAVSDDGGVTVLDDGPGIPENLRETIFERFRRYSGTSNGSGLGLSIVKRVVDAHKGSIRVTDGPGRKGSAFEIRIPIKA